jgi:hypothetical protein
MIGFCCLNFGEFTKTATGYAYENNGIRFKPIKKEKGLRLPYYIDTGNFLLSTKNEGITQSL